MALTLVCFLKGLGMIIGNLSHDFESDFLLFLERDDSRLKCLNWVIPRCRLAPELIANDFYNSFKCFHGDLN